MSLADHVRTLGRGPGRSRSLTRDEAADAMQLMLSGGAAPEAVGALLMLLRMKGEAAEEIAGFAGAAQGAVAPVEGVDLDWPSYAAGRTRGAPLFLTSARMVADEGHRVLMHGWNGADTKVRAGLEEAGIPVAGSTEDAGALIAAHGIAYLPLEVAQPALFALLNLRAVLGLRSCINTVCRMLNPGRAAASVQGVFHPSYRLLQADAAALMGWRDLSVIKGGGGEFERHPSKDIAAFGLRAGVPWQVTFPAISDETRRLAGDPGEMGDFERQVVTGTAALALETCGVADALARAEAGWNARRPAA
ncbi:glycosyl transferase family 3 [Oceanicola sp. 22II-s10i]|uniref:glycosyl transferase family protein n=1 Tax=Oceanicola sp. 22II-s10i TaxID=1317116 RepID=UPI000B5209B4|nr:glycosyl transferase family protein [Oceanicola sp. 22II-s10i]OWU83684.1 glycosyl transferase family 3 [Oceanicola sp. 22II-s10i]